MRVHLRVGLFLFSKELIQHGNIGNIGNITYRQETTWISKRLGNTKREHAGAAEAVCRVCLRSLGRFETILYVYEVCEK